MPTVQVTALRQFDYDGRKVAEGELVAMSPIDASVAARRGQVSLDRGVNSRSLQAQAERATADEPAPRKRYRRRDMQAEQ